MNEKSRQEVALKYIILNDLSVKQYVNITESTSDFYVAKNNIAIIKFKSPLNLGGMVAAACLSKDAPTDECYTYDHGYNKDFKLSPTLQELKMPVISTEECNKKEVYNNTVDEETICAGYGEDASDLHRRMQQEGGVQQHC